MIPRQGVETNLIDNIESLHRSAQVIPRQGVETRFIGEGRRPLLSAQVIPRQGVETDDSSWKAPSQDAQHR